MIAELSSTVRIISPSHHVGLDDYAAVGALALPVQDLRAHAAIIVPRFEDRTIWMVNSTAQGGGVAEMLPGVVALLRELGLAVEWVVAGSDDPDFFRLTKRIHNLVHGEGDPALTRDDRTLFETVSRRNSDALAARVKVTDVLVIHDPQTVALGAMLKESIGLPTIWRCHIGLDRRTPETSAAWKFLRPWATACDRAVFSAPEYIPDYLSGKATIIHPAVDPLSHKNRDLSIHKLVGILCNSGLIGEQAPPRSPPFEHRARRLQPDGRWAAATEPEDLGLLFRPFVTQVSRWDRLKGWRPLLRGFVTLKERYTHDGKLEPIGLRTIETSRLLLAGPDPEAIEDDPEGREVLDELRDDYLALPSALQREIAILALPMDSAKQNALMVNALQRCSTVVVQNSLREGFGLTVTEAMWKAIPVLGSSAAGIRQQIHDGLEGRLVRDPEDPDEIARALREMLADDHARDRWARAAQRRAHHDFLIFTQLRRWLEVLGEIG
ncbi:MAG TPA: glycosyltransferase [Gemmatimonadaceae bacterium]|nr:glycosyltransferase [Gemmatimonadaceae bacterium]